MSKYERLRKHLKRQATAAYELSFRQIEGILGDMLPRAAERPQWWFDDGAATPPSQIRALREAGFDATLLAGSDRVQFQRRS